MKLQDKVVILTGASDGIGRSIALKLAEEGCKLALLGRDSIKLSSLEALIPESKTYSSDITDQEELNKTVTAIKNDFQEEPDILINNAGIWHKTGDLDTLDAETIEKVIHTNLLAHIQLTRLLLPGLRKKEETAILNIISKSGVTAQVGQTVYTASKWGMKGFTDVLRHDLEETNVRIGAVYQSGTNTDMFRKAGETFSTEKLTEPDDLADIITFMLNRPAKIWLPEVHVQY